MLIRNYQDVPAISYEGNIQKRVVIGPEQGAPGFVMRIFDLPPGTASPWHQHDWEHEVFVLAGSGLAVSSDGETPIGPGDAILIAPNEMHSIKNTSQETLRFMCLVPLRGEG
nr:cupin domain-containing protein [Chloroflexota bacterium]